MTLARTLWFTTLCFVCLASCFGAPQTVAEPFDAGWASRWRVLGAQWQPTDGVMHASGTGDLSLKGRVWRDVEASVTVAITQAQGPPYWAGLRLRTDPLHNPYSGYLIYLRQNGSLEIWTGGRILAAHDAGLGGQMTPDRSVRLGARVTGRRIEGLIDGKVLVEAEDAQVRWGEVALAVCGATATFSDFACHGTTAGGVIYGQVLRYPDQTPLPDVLVETYHSMDGYPSLALKSTRTEADGSYYLEDLPEGERAYWLRACAEDMGGGTGWFVTVADEQPAQTDLTMLGKPPADVWVDSAALQPGAPWRELPDPQCYGGSRLVLRAPRRTTGSGLSIPFTVRAEGQCCLRIGCGVYPERHYWSPLEWRVDDGPWQDASRLAFDGIRYGDRASLVWARTGAMSLSAGTHTLALRALAGWAGSADEDYWTFDALAVAAMPAPLGPATAHTSTPELRWSGAPEREVVLQLSMAEDFSNGTLTVAHRRGGRYQVPADLRLADGAYWWRLKPQEPGDTAFVAAFGEPKAVHIATVAPDVTEVYASVRAPDHALIRWQTDGACESWLEWDVRTFAPRCRSRPTLGRRHHADLTGLQPMTCTRYWIVTRGPEGERRSLRRQLVTPRRELAGRVSPFGVFGQELVYAQEFHQAGVAWISDYWEWSKLEPRRGHFDWKQAEERMARAEAAGQNVTVTFWGSPAWIRPTHPDKTGWDFTYGPEDPDATAEFYRRIAAYCRGRAEWFLPWIEPNVARDTVFGFPRGYWASRPHARTYTAHERAAYRGAKRGNPDCRMVGMNTAGVDLGFIEKCYDEGAADDFDVMNVHYYAITEPFEKQDPERLFARLRELMAQYGDADKPIMCSEGGGASSGLPGTDEASQARQLVRIYVISIANRIDKLCWTFAYDPDPYGSDRPSMVPWMGLFGFDPDPKHVVPDLQGKPKPAYFAYRNMTSFLAGSTYRRRLELGEGIRAYRFEGAGAEHSSLVTVVWSEGEARAVSFARSGRLARCVNHLGAVVETAGDGHFITLQATPDPVFIEESR